MKYKSKILFYLKYITDEKILEKQFTELYVLNLTRRNFDMNDMIVIDNEIVPVYQTDTGEKVVYGSELHKVLGSPSTYREWAKRRLLDIDAVEKDDFEGVEISTPSGQKKKDHIIKLDSAKEMAMLERNEIGKKVRSIL